MKNLYTILITLMMLLNITSTYSQESSLEILERFCQLGKDANKINDYNTALFWYNKAKEYAIKQFGENDILVATSLSVIGNLQIKLGAQEEGIKSLQQCVAISAEYPSNFPQLHSDYIEKLGSGYLACGDYQNAIYYLNMALEVLTRGKKTPMYLDKEAETVLFAFRKCVIYHDLAIAYRKNGDYNNAIKYYGTAEKQIEKIRASLPEEGSIISQHTLYDLYDLCIIGISNTYKEICIKYIDNNDYKTVVKYYELAIAYGLSHPFILHNLDFDVLKYITDHCNSKIAIDYIDKYAQILINDTSIAAVFRGDDIESIYHHMSINLWRISQLYDKLDLTAKSYDFLLSRLQLFENAGIINQDYANAIVTMANWMQTKKKDFVSALDLHKKYVEVVASLCNNDVHDPELYAAIENMAACYGSCSWTLEINSDYELLILLMNRWEDILADMYKELGRNAIETILLEQTTQQNQDVKRDVNWDFWNCQSLLATKLEKIKLYIRLHEIEKADEVCIELEKLLIDEDRYDLLVDAWCQIIDHYVHESYYVRAKDLASYILFIYQNEDEPLKKDVSEHLAAKLAFTYLRLGDITSAYVLLMSFTRTITNNEDFIKKMYYDIENYILDNQSLSLLYQRWQEYDNALYHAKCAYDAFVEKDEPSKHPSQEMYLLSSLGDIYRALKRYDEAEDCLKKAIDIYETHYKDSIVDMWPMLTYLHLGNLYFDKQDFASAKEILHKVYNYCEKNEPNKLDAPASYLAEIYRQEDNYIEAKKYFTISWESFMESAQAQLKTMTPYERSLFWGNYWGFMEFYGGLAITAMPYYDDTYYNILLHWKSLLLRTDLDIDLFVQNSNNYDLKDLYLRMRRETDPQRKSEYEKEFAYLLASVYPNNNNIIEWQDIKKTLKKKEVAIEFAECWQKDSKQYAALIFRKDWDAPKMAVLCDEQKLEQIYKEQYRAYSEEWSKKLYGMIWAKLEPYINEGDEVYFSPTGLLHQMNIEVTQDAHGRLANERYKLHRVSSTRELCINRAKTKLNSAVLYGGLQYDMDSTALLAQSRTYSRTNDYMAVRGFVRDSTLQRGNWGSLNAAEDEVREISAKLNRHQIKATKYTHTAGTEESFKALSGKRTPIIHLATHGFFFTNEQAKRRSFFDMLDMDNAASRPDNSLKRSGLIMAGAQRAWNGEPIPDSVEDGILLAEEIAAMDLSGTDLVVLSACQTGLGEITSEGVFGLQRAFKKAGVQTLIMSLWKVDDQATKLMMTTFYDEWLSGKSKHEAFAIAQRTVRNTRGYENPYYWASFIMLD